MASKEQCMGKITTFGRQNGKGKVHQHGRKPRILEPVPLAWKLIGHWTSTGCGPKGTPYHTILHQKSSSVDDRLKPHDVALWQVGKGDIAVIEKAILFYIFKMLLKSILLQYFQNHF